MTEPIDIVDEYLQDPDFLGVDDVNLKTFMGGNYFSTPVAPPKFENEHKGIVFHAETGSSHITGALESIAVVFKCYGGEIGYTAARNVRKALYQYLHNARLKETASGLLCMAQMTSSFQGPPEPVTGWPVAIARYRITTQIGA